MIVQPVVEPMEHYTALNLVHVGAGVLVQLVARAEDDQRDLAVAQHRQLVSLLHHAKLPFVECDLDSIKYMTIKYKRGCSLDILFVCFRYLHVYLIVKRTA